MTERLRHEQRFHDAQARLRAGSARHAGGLRFRDADYLDHETWVRPAMARLGEPAGRRVLDFGCGHGMAAVVLARAGARVTAFDLSGGYLGEARRRAEANGVSVDFVLADGEHLPFADAAFDAVWGNAVLHHLDLHGTGGELRRVLRPGGVAVFCEPWGGNPLLNWARRRLPYPGKDRTPDERPLNSGDLDTLRRFFPGLELSGFQLLSMVRRLVPSRPLTAVLARCDRALLAACPGLEEWCRYVVLVLKR